VSGSLARPHLALICIDAFRADCLTGSPVWSDVGPPETPALDALAAAAAVHSNAVASSSWTKPSVPSLLTSLHPSEHGVFEVEKGAGRDVRTVGLPGDVPTLPELLRGAGYRTIGLTHNAQLDGSLGFSRGFDAFSSSAGTGDEILERLRQLDPFRDETPVFLYLHFLEPHWPYRGTVTRRADAMATGRFAFHRFRASQWKQLKRDLQSGAAELTPDETRFLRQVYRIAAEEADRVVGRCLEWLDRQRALDRSFVVLTADHGEELLDHGLVGHGQSLYDELVRVPMLLWSGTRAGVPLTRGSTDDPTSHVDVLPTIAAAARVPVDHTVSGRSLLNGRDPSRDHAFSEVKHKRRYLQAIRGRRWKLVRQFRFARDSNAGQSDYNNLDALFADRPYTVEHVLFDLREDPAETTDRFAAEPEVAHGLVTELDTWWGGLSVRGQTPRALEDQLIRRLEALGYL